MRLVQRLRLRLSRVMASFIPECIRGQTGGKSHALLCVERLPTAQSPAVIADALQPRHHKHETRPRLTPHIWPTLVTYSTTMVLFGFDPEKAASNLRKHGISFREAMTVSEDPLAATFPDELHSEPEDCSVTIGLSSRHQLLFVAHCESEDGIRLIGARRANASERKAYEDLKARS